MKISTQVQTNSDWVFMYFFGGNTTSASGNAAEMRKLVKNLHKCVILKTLCMDLAEKFNICPY